MRIAILSDVHGNLEALEAVLADLQRHRPDEVYLLGDAVNYGCDSVAVVARLREQVKPENWLLGNHEELYLGAPPDIFGEEARLCNTFTTAELEGTDSGQFLQQRKGHFQRTQVRRVHNKLLVLSHHRPVFTDVDIEGYYDPDYLAPYTEVEITQVALQTPIPAEHVPPQAWLQKLLGGKGADQLIFLGGHTHLPAFASLAPSAQVCTSQKTRAGKWRFGEFGGAQTRFFINPGSVGYPRDGCTKASYAMLDLGQDTCEIIRVPYTLNLAALERRYKETRELRARTVLGGLTQKIKNASVPNGGKMPADWWEFYQKEPC